MAERIEVAGDRLLAARDPLRGRRGRWESYIDAVRRSSKGETKEVDVAALWTLGRHTALVDEFGEDFMQALCMGTGTAKRAAHRRGAPFFDEDDTFWVEACDYLLGVDECYKGLLSVAERFSRTRYKERTDDQAGVAWVLRWLAHYEGDPVMLHTLAKYSTSQARQGALDSVAALDAAYARVERLALAVRRPVGIGI